jgi:hypothetical protein
VDPDPGPVPEAGATPGTERGPTYRDSSLWRWRGPVANFFLDYGRVPLFFYFGQWYTAHLLAILLGVIAGQPVAWQWESPIDKFMKPPLPGIGFPLWVVYLCWIGGVLLLYPLCKWFAGVKARRRDWWLSYL